MISIVILSVAAILALFLGLNKNQQAVRVVSISGIVFALADVVRTWNTDMYFYYDMLHFDNFSNAFVALILATSLFIFILSKGYFESISDNLGEYYAVLLFSMVGAISMCAFNNLAMLFIGIETLSISMYIMAGIRKKSLSSNEAALKYFLMGSFSTGFLLFGIALVYGATGTFDIEKIAVTATYLEGMQNVLLLAGVLFLIVSLSFKVGAAPFHFWTPDVYDGSPSIVTAFMSTVVKTAGVVAFLKLFDACFAQVPHWQTILAIIAVITLIIGNITAIYQTTFKRMLAYSSISHAGYLLMAIVSLGDRADNAIFVYTMAYSLSSVVAFACLMNIKKKLGYDDFDSFNGLAKASPGMALALTIAMLSMAGIPLTAGFFGKFYVFSNTFNANYTWLVLVAVVNAVIGMGYYLKVIISMYMKENKENNEFSLSFNEKLVLATLTLLTLALGIYPELINF